MRIRKRIGAWTLVLCLLLGMIPTYAGATDEVASGTCGDNVTWVLDDSGTLTISGTGAMANYDTTNHAPWYDYRDSITRAVLESGVTTVGEYAFLYCRNMTSLTLPATVTSVNRDWFSGCDALSAIDVDSGNPQYSSADGVLFNQDKTTILYYPQGKTGSYSVPDSVTTIDASAFNSCANLTEITIPDSVSKINRIAFAYSALTSVKIPGNVTEIAQSTFSECRSLRSVTIPLSVTSIGRWAFNICSALTDVYYDGTKEEWNAISISSTGNAQLTGAVIHCSDGDINGSDTTAQGTCGDNATWTLDDGTLTISGTGAMTDYDSADAAPWHDYRASITKAVVQSGITNLGNHALNGCANLTEVTLPNGLTTIGASALRDCSSLSAVTIPDSVTTIDGHAFRGSGVRDVRIPSGVALISDNAFMNCASLTTVRIPASVTSVGQYAFSGSGLTDVYYQGTETQWNGVSVDASGNAPLTSATMHYEDADDWTTSSATTLASVSVANSRATAYDASGAAITSGITWSVTPANSGVTISNDGSNAGRLTVSTTAPAQEYVVTATPDSSGTVGGSARSATFNVTHSYSVTYAANGGTGTMNPETIEPPFVYVLRQNEFTPPDGMKFKAWRVGNTEYAPGDTVWEDDTTLRNTSDGVELSSEMTVTAVWAKDTTVTLTSVTLNPSSVTLDGANGASVTASAIGSDDNAIISGVTWSVAPADSSVTDGGVTINATSGAVTVAADAKAGEYIVTATPDSSGAIAGNPLSATLTVTHGNSVAASITLSGGQTQIQIPGDGQSAVSAAAYTATVYDQFRAVMPNASVDWTITNPDNKTVSGVTISNGVVTVTNAAKDTIESSVTMTVQAVSGNASATASINVSRAASELASVTLDPSSVTLDGSNGAKSNATAFDQYGAAITSGVTWSVAPEDSSVTNGGVTINATSGEIEVAANASAGNYIVTATYESVSQSARLTVTRTVTAVTLTSVALNPSANGGTVATAYDANNNEITSGIVWSVTPPDSSVADNAVTIDSAGAITTSPTAPAGSYTITATPDSTGLVVGQPQSAVFNVTRTYAVEFDANGGGGEMSAQSYTVTSGETGAYTLPQNAFTPPDGMRFRKWSVNNTEYDPGVTLNLSGNVTVHALWEEDGSAIHIIFLAANSASGPISGTGSDDYYELAAVDNDEIKTLRIKSGVSLRSIGSYTPGAGYDNAQNCMILNNAVYDANDLLVSGSWVSASSLETGVAQGISLINSGQVRAGSSDLTLSGSANAYFVDGSNIERIQVSDIVSDTNDMVYYVTDEGEISQLFIVNVANDRDILASGYCGGEGDGTNLSWVLTNDGTLTISGSGAMADYEWNSAAQRTTAPWGDNRGSITTLVLESGATTIGNYAFDSCQNMTSVSIPDSVTSIGVDAFSFCSGLTSVSIPNSVTSIGSSAFSFCSGLTSVSIPNSVTSIGELAFGDCSGLTSVNVDSGNANYSSENGILFNKNKSAILCYPAGKSESTYAIPGSVTTIGKSAFSSCRGLTSVSIPNSVTEIGESAFLGCSGLTSVSIPDSVTSIGDVTFLECRGLTSVSIPDSVTSIGERAFAFCSGLTSVSIPDSVTSIGSSAFAFCSGLTSVSIPNTVTSIADDAFYACSGMTSVSIPNSVTSIGNGAFYNCIALTDVYYGGARSQWNAVTIDDTDERNGVLHVATIHFAEEEYTITFAPNGGSSSMNPVTVTDNSYTLPQCGFTAPDGMRFRKWSVNNTEYDPGATVTLSGDTTVTALWETDDSDIIASGYCGGEGDGTNLSWVLTNGGKLTISGSGIMADYSGSSNTPWYDYRESVSTVMIESGVTSIGKYAFDGCSGLRNMTISNSVTSIGEAAFRGSALTSVTISSGVTSIGEYAFVNCSGLTNVTIPASVTSIGNFAFNYCSALTNVNVDSGNANYSSENGILFNKNKSAILCYPDGKTESTYMIPTSVTSIGEGAFSGCSGLTSVTISDSVTSIGAYAFYACSGLASVTIPVGVTSIEPYTFCQCNALKDVYYGGTRTQWNAVSISDNVDVDTSESGNAPLHSATIHCTDGDIVNGVTTYTVTFAANGGRGTMNPVTVTDNAYTLPANGFTPPDGMRFRAWSVYSDEYAPGDTISLNDNVTVTAVWESDSENYTITFAANGGAGTMNPEMFAVTPGQTYRYTLPQNGFTPPDGMRFSAWSVYTSNSATSTRDERQPGDTVTLVGNTTVTAVWETDSETYTITFAPNGGSGAMNPVTFELTPGQSYRYELPQNAFTPPNGMRFRAWFVNNAEYAPGETVDLRDNVTVTAQWERTYTITFAANGGAGAMNPVTVTDNAYTLPQNAFTPPDGMRFRAWSVHSGEYAPGDTISLSDSVTVTALWETIPVSSYTVTFAANGGAGTMNPVTVSDNAYTLPQNAFTPPDGMRFRAWSVYSDEYAPGDTISLSGDVTVTALWETIPVSSYTVTYYLTENAAPYQTDTVSVGEPYALMSAPPVQAPIGGGASWTVTAWNINGTRYNPGETIFISADTVAVAVIHETVTRYVNIWLDGDGSELDRVEWGLSTSPGRPTEKIPVKAEDEEASYIFRGWDSGSRTENTVSSDPDHETLTITTTYQPIFDVISKLDPYRILDRLQDMDGYIDQTWHLAGPLSEFQSLNIDETVLTRESGSGQQSDYSAEEGSTKLNIPAGTFARFGEGTHSIAADFQTMPDSSDPGDDGRRVTADYYTVKPSGRVRINADEINGGNGVEAAKAVRDVSYTGRFHTIPRLNDDYFRLTVIDGALPNGLYFHDGGYFTGTPLIAGTYTFTVGLQIRRNVTDEWPETYEDTAQVTITVEQDTTQNVETASDEGYELVERIPATVEVDTVGEWVHLTSKGPFDEFTDFYIDGVRKVRGVDYVTYPCLIDVDTGEVMEVIRPLDGGVTTGTFIQLQKSQLSLGTHSLNLEFVKTDPIGNKQVRNASQKVTVTQRATPAVVPASTGGGGGGSSGGSSSGNSGPTYYSVKVSQSSHGTISASAKSAISKATVTITVTPESGYRVKSVSAVDSKKAAVKLTNSGNKYTFTMPSRAVTVSATFERSVYDVSASAAQHGKITLNSSSASPGATVNGSTTPEKGYLLSGVTVRDADGKNVRAETFNDGKFTFLMPTGKATVSATFTVKRLASFVDIQGPDWFFDDAEWAYNKSILRGTTEQYWEPQSLMSSVTSIVTLERLDGVDLTPYDTGADDGIDNSQWYASAQRWARDNDILLKDRPFGEREAMTRGECAVMLINFLRYRGLNVTPTNEAFFTDTGDMTPEELDAFRFLQDANVFRGYADGSIRPKAYLSRAHLSALLHRLSEYIIKTETDGII